MTIPSIDYYKKNASQLLQNLKSEDFSCQKKALAKFQNLERSFSHLSEKEILLKAQKKHALAVVALEAGFSSWASLKQSLDAPDLDLDFFGSSQFGGSTNHWFRNYQEAKKHLVQNGGYLFPYRNQCFITQISFIESLGMDPADQDWARIDYDWVSPKCPHAWFRLKNKLLKKHRSL